MKAYLAILYAGLVAVPLPTDLTRESFVRIIADAGIRELYVSNQLLNRVRAWAAECGLKLVPENQERDFGGKRCSGPARINANRELAALLFTSGSTGAPRGVMITHRNFECNTRDIIAYLNLSAEDKVMAVLPFHYCFGLSLLHTHLFAGGCVVTDNEFKLFPESMLLQMQRQECTGFAGVPSTYQILLRNSRFRRMQFPKLRWFQQAGGKLPNACIQEIVQAFPDVPFYVMYGQTEATARLSYLPPGLLVEKLGSIGKGLPSAKLQVLRPDGTTVRPGSDEIGEIVASGNNIAAGYWNDPAETARYFRGGKLHTGDLARVDKDGYIFIMERERDMIKSGGNRISAKEVEDVIAQLQEVVEVAVVGCPHELLGESITAFVSLASNAKITVTDILAHCHKHLSRSRTPQEITVTPSLPHNSSGKVLKTKLRELLYHRHSAHRSTRWAGATTLPRRTNDARPEPLDPTFQCFFVCVTSSPARLVSLVFTSPSACWIKGMKSLAWTM